MDVDICRYVCSFMPIGRTAVSRHAFRLVFRDNLMPMPGSLCAVATLLIAIVFQLVIALFQTRFQAICEIFFVYRSPESEFFSRRTDN